MQCPCGGEVKSSDYEPVQTNHVKTTHTCSACKRVRIVLRDRTSREVLYEKG